MIKMVNEFKLTIVHFARPNSMQIYGCAWIYRWTKKTVENQDWVTGQPDHRAKGPSRARGPQAVGRWAFGLPGRRGPLGRGPAFSKTHIHLGQFNETFTSVIYKCSYCLRV